MGQKVRGPDGREYDTTELQFQNVREHFNEYLLDDGTVLKMKAVATKVLRVEGAYDAQGNPAYILESTNVLVVKPLEAFKRGGGEDADPNA